MYTDFVKYNVYRFLSKNQIVLKLANSLNIFIKISKTRPILVFTVPSSLVYLMKVDYVFVSVCVYVLCTCMCCSLKDCLFYHQPIRGLRGFYIISVSVEIKKTSYQYLIVLMILLSISKWMLGTIIVLMDVKGKSSCKSSNDI